MKTLVNRENPKVKITAPEIETLYDKYHRVKYYYIKDLRMGLLRENWALVEEEPEFEHRRKDTIYFLETAKTHYADTSELEKCIEWLKGLNSSVEEEPEKVNCPFDKSDCRYCTVQFCGAREENQIETRSTAEPVNLEETVEFNCIGKKVKMTVQELINYYIDSECADVADECGF